MTEDAPGTAVMIPDIPTAGGMHCETTALGALLAHAGTPLSEPMLFGLGSGLSFVYWDSKRQDAPFLGGRVKPFALTRNLAARLRLELREQETSSPRKAWEQVRAAIDAGIPVGLQLDSYDLEYFTSKVHFAGHMVAMRGYDDERAHLIDTAQQGGAVSTSLASLAAARAAKGPMSARNRSFVLAVPDPDAVAPDRLVPAAFGAIAACAEEFLAPPIANLGVRGIRTAAGRIPAWLGRVSDPGRDLALIATLMERGGTGGALFRNLYRDFLGECLERVDGGAGSGPLAQGHALFAESAALWTEAAGLIGAAAGGDPAPLGAAAARLRSIADIEGAAMTALLPLAALADVG